MSPAVCVFCGSRNGFDPAYATEAQKLGAGLAQSGWPLVGDIEAAIIGCSQGGSAQLKVVLFAAHFFK